MDNLRNYLAALWKHRFWVACVVVIALGVGTWHLAAAKLRSETEQYRRQIEAEYSKAKGILKKGIEKNERLYHPNDKTFAETAKLINRLKVKIREAWQEQYEHQKSVFVWPEDLSAEFRATVEKLRPIETVPYPTPLEKEINADFRETYRDFIKSQLPKLADIVGARWFELEGTGTGGARESASSTGRDVPIVLWDPKNQKLFQQKMSVFPGQENNVPSTLQLLYAQENLWVLTSLLEIIKRTNGDAEAYWQAPIKEIKSILIGSDVGGARGRVKGVATSGYLESTGGGAVTPSVGGDPAEGRYVDKHFKPLSAEQLRNSYTSTDPEEAYLSVAKRMPVRLLLVMDQRMINRLLVECANSPLTVEARQVRINPGGTAGGSATTTGSIFDQRRPFTGSSTSSESTAANRFPFDRTVEIYGVIYIYNPVPTDKLVVDTGDASGNNDVPAGAAGGEASADETPEPGGA